MRPTPESIMCFLASLLALSFLAQAQNLAPDSIRSLVDVSKGMPGDFVISQLRKNGYMLQDESSRISNGNIKNTDSHATWGVLLSNKIVGEVTIQNGKVTAAERRIFDSRDEPNKNNTAFGLADALYWIMHDSGTVIPSEETALSMQKRVISGVSVEVRKVDLRDTKISWRMIFFQTADASYRITIYGTNTGDQVTIDQLAPFPRKTR